MDGTSDVGRSEYNRPAETWYLLRYRPFRDGVVKVVRDEIAEAVVNRVE